MRVSRAIRRFIKLEASSGIILMMVAALAMVIANSPAQNLYSALLGTTAEIRVGTLEISKPLLLWINDGLMAIFFMLVGLEVKREVVEGELSDPSKVALPAAAAIGGMLVPSIIYFGLNFRDPTALAGWAIPAATDIAFALGVLSLLGPRVPNSLKVFLLTVAIIDDLAAIGIIAIFYSGDLSILALFLALGALAILLVLNRAGVSSLAPYLIVGAILWVMVLKSGVHATLAGVATAFMIPIGKSADQGSKKSPLHSLEHTLHPWVAFGIMPLFAFANAGLPISNIELDTVLHPVPLGIFFGLVVGKPLGVTIFSWTTIRLGIADIPHGAKLSQLIGVGMLSGIGFTMSLFIASLAFEHGAEQYFMADRIGILAASFVAAVLGYSVLRLTSSGGGAVVDRGPVNQERGHAA
ncbi:MAG: Na+/H+ antiporter NhaA [Anaerolineales bacterium]|nr:Na+/H+ antiporter NhaA [Anaerolineales bacterium]